MMRVKLAFEKRRSDMLKGRLLKPSLDLHDGRGGNVLERFFPDDRGAGSAGSRHPRGPAPGQRQYD